jgi:mediator of RNA polymerase II transcription subunit 12
MVLVALIDRFKGVAQALTCLSGAGKPPGHNDYLIVSDLYTWYVYSSKRSVFANRL